MNYKTEFPNYQDEIPALEGFIDTSYGNDACPSFELPLSDGLAVRVWVEYADPSQRESQLGRFIVELNQDDEFSTILTTEDLDLVYFVVDLIKRGAKSSEVSFLCSWNGSLFELHTEESLRRDYGNTNLFLEDSPWGRDNETDFEIVLRKLKTKRYVNNWCDNMSIFRLSGRF